MKYHIQDEILRMWNYVRKHYWEDIGLEDIAGCVGYSPRRCNLLFRSCYGETLGTYLRFLRMEDAKRLLDGNLPIDRVACSLSYTPRGFRKAFQEYFGVSPSQYVKDGLSYERYSDVYEYHGDGNWGKGENPTPDGLWEFACYDPATREYIPMEWRATSAAFTSPEYGVRTSPQWYCQNRDEGYGMHPGRGTHVVKTFLCPKDGEISVFFSFSRNIPYKRRWNSGWKSWKTPCSARLYLNDLPLGDEVVMTTVDPAFLKAECTVRAGDQIRLHIDPMGDHVADGVVLYRQTVSYFNPMADPSKTKVNNGGNAVK